ncbi:DUF1795 domain-containing protein [Deinococcus alpinitundrae]|uniref:DUF1795 domain-containing protein n=1 Tax=Deinococcus alpinitundrae TaxID=468913 RepID=UPI001379BD35|nr:DUF1795 domain-containing protein [Deinococcus alpinitundrae]
MFTSSPFSVLSVLTALTLTTALAVPLTSSTAPFQADVPAGWAQRAYPNDLPGILVIAPGTPPPVVLQLFYAPYKSAGNDAKALAEFIGGVEGSMIGDGRGTVKRLSTRSVTVGGVKGTQREYDLTVKANGVTVHTNIWYGVSARNLLSFQATSAKQATQTQKGALGKMLSSIKFK